MPRYAHCLVACRLGDAVRRAPRDTVADLACCGGVVNDAGDDAWCLAATIGGRGALVVDYVFFDPRTAVTAGRSRF